MQIAARPVVIGQVALLNVDAGTSLWLYHRDKQHQGLVLAMLINTGYALMPLLGLGGYLFDPDYWWVLRTDSAFELVATLAPMLLAAKTLMDVHTYCIRSALAAPKPQQVCGMDEEAPSGGRCVAAPFTPIMWRNGREALLFKKAAWICLPGCSLQTMRLGKLCVSYKPNPRFFHTGNGVRVVV